MGNDAAFVPRVPSASQRLAIEADARPLLVLAGPGAGKTFCLIERIGFLIDKLDVKPERICVFTFTNKAAGEIAGASRASSAPRESASSVGRFTRSARVAARVREHVGLPGFGTPTAIPAISAAPARVPTKMPRASSIHSRYRFRGEPMSRKYQILRRLSPDNSERNVADFDLWF